MSLSSNEKMKNPATKFIEWKGSTGEWKYYDKLGGQNVIIGETIYIVPLDDLSTIKGWNDESGSGIYSNEVKLLNEEVLTVKSFKGGEIIRGLYKDIKGNLDGGKFCKSIYAVLLSNKGKIEGLVNVSFVGSSLSSWIESKVRISDANVLTLTKDPVAKKKGATSYFVPTITSSKPEDESIIEKAKELDVELQEFLTEYRNKPMSESHINKTESDGVPSFIPPKEVIKDNEKIGLPF